MTKRWFVAVGVGTLALLLGGAGTSRAQFFFFPIGPMGAMSPWSGVGGWGYYPGGVGMNYFPRTYGVNYAGYSYPSTFGTGLYPGYTWNPSSYYSYGVGRPTIFGTPSSLAVPPVSYVAYYPPLYSAYSPSPAPASALLPADQPATVEVTAPADAEITFDGQRTSQTDTHRTFTTPPLEKGRSYHYTVTARWRGGPADGQTQRVGVYAGAHVSVVFPVPK